jgi:hypothetical protein
VAALRLRAPRLETPRGLLVALERRGRIGWQLEDKVAHFTSAIVCGRDAPRVQSGAVRCLHGQTDPSRTKGRKKQLSCVLPFPPAALLSSFLTLLGHSAQLPHVERGVLCELHPGSAGCVFLVESGLLDLTPEMKMNE